MVQPADQEARVLSAVLSDPVCVAVLDRLPGLGLKEWWLTGGAVFQNVWNASQGRPPGFGIRDYDVFYYDADDLSWAAEDSVIQDAGALFADLPAPIELRNQARVHLWYEEKFGRPCPPFRSATDAIDSFVSTTGSIGMTKDESGIRIYAPFGLSDLIAMHLRPNHRLAPQRVYDDKVRQYTERWPTLTSDPW